MSVTRDKRMYSSNSQSWPICGAEVGLNLALRSYFEILREYLHTIAKTQHCSVVLHND